MINFVKQSLDQLLGRGDAAITVPPMDGPLKPNQAIEEGEAVTSFESPEDLLWDGQSLWVADGQRLLRQEADQTWSVQASFEKRITALAHSVQHGVLAAVGGTAVHSIKGSAWKQGDRLVAGMPLSCITGLCALDDGSVIVTEGSNRFPTEQWSHDLMSLGQSGRVCRLTPDASNDQCLLSNLRYPFGAVVLNRRVWMSESWSHRVVQFDPLAASTSLTVLSERLPAYPSRLAPASDGGAWVTMFAARTRLVEFVLREPEYRRRMMKDVDPRYWVAPALSSGQSYMEPLQGGSVKQLGIMKPWAPPRSYGLVVRLNAQGHPIASFHSRSDGRNHGVVAACEAHGALYVLSKGSGRLVRIALESTKTKQETA